MPTRGRSRRLYPPFAAAFHGRESSWPWKGGLLRFAPRRPRHLEGVGELQTARRTDHRQRRREFTHVRSTQEERLRIHVRWMIRRDMREVLGVEQEAFEFPWSDEDFTRCLRQRNCIGMVAESGESVVAFMIYELHRSRLHVLNFAVARSHRRLGIGTRMMEKLIGKLTPERRNRLVLEVRETNLPAQLFFRSLGFRAISVLKDFYQDTTEDAYLMHYVSTAAVAAEAVPRRMAG